VRHIISPFGLEVDREATVPLKARRRKPREHHLKRGRVTQFARHPHRWHILADLMFPHLLDELE